MPSTSSKNGTTTAAASSGRLRSGQLRAQVAQVLADHRKSEHSPRQVAAALERSAGAVGNALRTLAEQGAAQVTSTAPLRYTATRTTRKAATAAPASANTSATSARPRKSGGAAQSTRGKPAANGAAASGRKTGSSGASAAASSVPVSGPVARPNGQQYHPRKLAGLPDVTALRKLREAEVPVLLYGPPGTGKTAVVEAAFPDVVTVAGDGDTAVADLVG